MTSFGDSANPGNSPTYVYDDAGHLTAADRTAKDKSYSHDDNGNRTNTGYVTANDNRLSSDGYLYDTNGT